MTNMAAVGTFSLKISPIFKVEVKNIFLFRITWHVYYIVCELWKKLFTFRKRDLDYLLITILDKDNGQILI